LNLNEYVFIINNNNNSNNNKPTGVEVTASTLSVYPVSVDGGAICSSNARQLIRIAHESMGTPMLNLSPPTFFYPIAKFFGQNVPHKWVRERSSRIFAIVYHHKLGISPKWRFLLNFIGTRELGKIYHIIQHS